MFLFSAFVFLFLTYIGKAKIFPRFIFVNLALCSVCIEFSKFKKIYTKIFTATYFLPKKMLFLGTIKSERLSHKYIFKPTILAQAN